MTAKEQMGKIKTGLFGTKVKTHWKKKPISVGAKLVLALPQPATSVTARQSRKPRRRLPGA